jgi:uncharacterized spore protein YtfJ
MKLDELMTSARDAITVRRVFAEPYEKNGVTIIAAATVTGGGGGGTGHDQNGGEGEGGGFGVSGRPAGAYIIRDDDVVWRPAVDVNRLVPVVGAVLIAWLLTRARIKRTRMRTFEHMAEQHRKVDRRKAAHQRAAHHTAA